MKKIIKKTRLKKSNIKIVTLITFIIVKNFIIDK